MRRFKGDDGIVRRQPAFKTFDALARFGRQEAVKIKIRLAHAGHAQRAHHGTRPHHGHHAEPCFAHARRQFRTRVAHGGRARIGNLRHALPAFQRGNDFVGHLLFVVFAHGQQLGTDAVCRQKLCRHARVFGAHQIDRLQNGKGAQGDVGQIADGRGHDIQGLRLNAVECFLEMFLHGGLSGCRLLLGHPHDGSEGFIGMIIAD